MKLSEATQGDVVQNDSSGSFYRAEGLDKGRARIRPLEILPNGLLIPKPVDTVVDQALEVTLIGVWHDGFTVAADVPRKSRRTFERELERKHVELQELQQEKLTINPRGLGSHQNKIKAVRWRIDVLERGLAVNADQPLPETTLGALLTPKRFRMREIVQLPSGAAAMVAGFNERPDRVLEVSVLAKQNGSVLCTQVEQACLRPIADRYHSTI